MKPVEIGGLKPNWKAQIGIIDPKKTRTVTTISRRNSSPEPNDEDAQLDLEGEFAQDESPATLAAVRASKARGSMGLLRSVKPDVKGTAKVPFPYLLVCCHLDVHE